MRFNDFFTAYKLKLMEAKISSPWLKPLYRKIIAALLVLLLSSSVILLVTNHIWGCFVIFILVLILTFILIIMDSTKKNLQQMLEQHRIPYSQNRIQILLELLSIHKVDITKQETIDLLIEQAKEEKLRCDPFALVKKPLKTLSSVIIPILAFVATKYAEAITIDTLLVLALQVIIIILASTAMIFSILPIVKELIYRDATKYDELIYDLKQLKIFEYNISNYKKGK